jgi:ornithine carbamoyltransferase
MTALQPETAAAPVHLLGLEGLAADGFSALLELAAVMKRHPLAWRSALDGRAIACLFEQPSTRSRVSLEVAVHRLGAHPVVLPLVDESLAETASELSSYCDALAVRTPRHRDLLELAEHASVPVLNLGTDREHPCRALAECLMLRERFGELRGLEVAYVGGEEAVANSLIEAAMLSGMVLRLAAPLPDPALLGRAGQTVQISGTPEDGAAAVLGAAAPNPQQVADRLPVQQAILRALVTGDWEV